MGDETSSRESTGQAASKSRAHTPNGQSWDASPTSVRNKGRVSTVGFLVALALGALTWRANMLWIAVPLLAFAAAALAHVLWQWHKLHETYSYRR